MDRDKALDMALASIEKQFGKGSVMKMGDKGSLAIESIPTGALALDIALGIGGLPRGRVTEIYGPESSGKSTLAMHVVAEAQRNGGICAYVDAEHAMDPVYARAIGVDVDELLISQPDTGEQALEITDMLIRSGAIDVVVIDSVAALTPRAEIEGDMGDTHVGLQARLMSQALRKLTANLNRSNTICIFINQLREKIGVMFGCWRSDTKITLGDGSEKEIGAIVKNRLPVEVLSYDADLGRVVPRKVVNWFDNGVTESFLHFTLPRVSGAGPSPLVACTPNHLLMTPGGWQPAGELVAGDRLLHIVEHKLSDFQWEVLLGGLMGDGALSSSRSGQAARFRWGHCAKQASYGDWKASLFANLTVSRSTSAKGAVFHDVQPLPELVELRNAVYMGGLKVLSDDYLKQLSPLSLAVWYQDDGGFTLRSKGLQERTRGGSGRSEICVQAFSPDSRLRLQQYLSDTWGITTKLALRGARQMAVLQLPTAETAKFHALIAPFVHPTMQYKLLAAYRGRFAVEPVFAPTRNELVPLSITAITEKPSPQGKRHRYDIEVEGGHCYFAGGVLVHNSPETTPGGRALKFYSSVRIDIRRIESIKDGAEVVGNRTRTKVVKNKCFAAGTTVFDPTTGLTHRIEDVVERGEGQAVVAADKVGGLHVRPITQRFDQGEAECVGLALRDGTELWVTPEHRVLTEAGWREAGELAVGDRVARPRRWLGFGDAEPVPASHARLLGHLMGDGGVTGRTPVSFTKRIPAAFFTADVSSQVVGNLLVGIWESGGYVSGEQTGAIRVGFTTTAEQLAQQLHWLLLRFGIGSSVRAYDPTQKGASIIGGRRVQGKGPCWEVRVSGLDNVRAFADALPISGPKGQMLVQELAGLHRRRRGSQRGYLPATVTEPVLAYLRGRGVTPTHAAALVGDGAGDPKGTLKQVLGVSRLRRDRVERLAEALDSDFLAQVLDEEVWYDKVVAIRPAEWRRIYDVEVAEHHTLVAADVVASNCSPPFRQAEFDIMYGKGISREGSLLDVGVELGLVKKSGAWFTYEGEQLGQGRENAKAFLADNAEIAVEIDERIRTQVGLGTGGEEAAHDPRVDPRVDPFVDPLVDPLDVPISIEE